MAIITTKTKQMPYTKQVGPHLICMPNSTENFSYCNEKAEGKLESICRCLMRTVEQCEASQRVKTTVISPNGKQTSG